MYLLFASNSFVDFSTSDLCFEHDHIVQLFIVLLKVY